jgi:micrococcal nuclease
MKRIFKITGISIAGIFALLIIVGLVVGPRSDSGSGNQTEASSSNGAIALQDESDANSSSMEVEMVADVATGEAVQVQSAQTGTAAPSQPSSKSDLVPVVDVVDGDTLKVSLDGETQTIRLIGIDTPEVVDPRKPVQCFGEQASAKAKATLTGQMARLEIDPSQGNVDKYGRLLRYVYLADGTFFNEMMVAQGYAHEYTYDTPYKYQAEFKAAQAAAEKTQLGLWSPSTCNGNTTQAVALSTVSGSVIPSATPAGQSAGHIFYLSIYYTATYYYCDTDDGWKSLSSKYLKSYPSQAALLVDYPSRTLHAACE